MSDVLTTVTTKLLTILSLPSTTTTILPTTNLVDDLGADSLDLLELITAIETTYQLSITDSLASTCKTVGDVVRVVSTLTASRGLTLYESRKHVHAVAMSSDLWMDALVVGGITGKHNTTKLEPGLAGYKVIYNLGTDEQYTSWCPEVEFLKNNIPVRCA